MKNNRFSRPVVCFADFRSNDDENLQQKFTRLMKVAGLGKLDLADRFVAIKMHFGEMTGIGGALKNLGMGGGSRAGKKAMHSTVHPTTRWREAFAEGERMKLGSSHYILRKI